MKKRMVWLGIVGAGLAAVMLLQFSLRAQAPAAVRPATVAPMQNLAVKAGDSGRPVYLPREWGRLIGVEKTGSANYTLFLQAESGEIYVVRLIQSGDYLYLDTYDKGGVALVIQREP